MKGQISAEMLILLAVVIAIVAIAAVYIMNAAKQGGQAV
ncbi:class III signal peptide-containing protein, partial [Candidatus Micrarchaeota archaeon]|nr:class III signal peptide-containing protein [Candidatus Micrarchaeota archaeon]